MFEHFYQLDKNVEIFKNILLTGQNIFPISEEIDKKCLEINNIENWADCFYNIKKGIFKQRFIELMSKTEYCKFFEALNYEYGINGYPLDIKKAFQIYKTAAETSTDTLSMFRLYRIYKNEYQKFNLERNTVYEKYYLFKSCAFMTNNELNGTYLCNKIDILGEVKLVLEDNNLSLLDRFFKYLKENYKLYNLNMSDLVLVHAVIKIIFTLDDDDKRKSRSQLINLSKQNNFEATYKLICFIEDKKEEKNFFAILYKNNYYRSFVDYALYLNEKNRKSDALNILKIAIKNGYYSNILHYFDLFFEINDFDDIMKSPQEKNDFLFIIGCIIDFIIADGVYSFFEYIYIRHVCIKNFNFQNEFKYFEEYTKEIVDYLIKITEGSEEDNKQRLKRYCISPEYTNELYFVCGILYYYGIEGILEKNYNKSFNKIDISFKNSKSKSYKRFCYTYMYKIKEKILKKENALNNKNKQIPKEDKELIKIKNELFKMYYNEINGETFDNLSSSFFYYLSKLYKKKIGNKGDPLMEYIFMNKAANSNGGGGIGLNSFIVYYRKYKSKKIIKEKNKDEYLEKLNTVEGYKNVEGYGEDGSICPICYDNKKTTICLPCKHFFCGKCMKKLVDKSKCPICRTIIIMTFNIISKKEELIKSRLNE